MAEDEKQTVPSPIEVLIKEEPGDIYVEFTFEDCLKEEPDTILSENEQDPIPVESRQQPNVDMSRCNFCLKSLVDGKRVQFAPGCETAQRTKIEFVLSIKLNSEPQCCFSCWQMIELFNGFKRSCYMALFKPDELIGAVIPAVESFTVVKDSTKLVPQPPSEYESLTATVVESSTVVNVLAKSVPESTSGHRSLTPNGTVNGAAKLVSESATEDGSLAPIEESSTDVKHSAGLVPEPAQEDGSRTDLVQCMQASSQRRKSFGCRHCGKRFAIMQSLLTHKHKCYKLNSEKYSCHVCFTACNNRLELQAHLRSHSDKNLFKCRNEGCYKAYFYPELRVQHEQKCGKTKPLEPVNCKICGIEFPSAHSILGHMLTHKEAVYECKICNKKFIQRNRLKTHWTTHFRKEIETAYPEALNSTNNVTNADQTSKDQNQSSNNNTAVKTLICDMCNTTFLSKEDLSAHKISCTKLNPFQHKSNLLRCTLCPAIFDDQQSLQYHVDRHNGIKSAYCRNEGCTNSYFDARSRRNHEKVCGKELRFVCNVCGAVVKSEGTFRTHMANHDDPKHPCGLCAKKFHTRAQLKKHSSVHSDERKHECKVCGKRFKSHEANRVHQRIHTQEKPYPCHICEKRFTYNCQLKTHLQKGHG
ncbi:zinc finger protein 431-like [Malaya genurostris]|uniref:zinc finger protein 431-like n=1 Tax=Malaya genurostris TaxID=325434 RepID=UPI0026F3E1E9|nr:zinc finger protein 431-like [Malaya genurostris]